MGLKTTKQLAQAADLPWGKNNPYMISKVKRV